MTVDPKALEAAENAYASATVDLPHHDCDRCGGSGTIITIAAELGAGGDVCPVCGGGGVIVDFPDDWNPMVNAIRAYLAALPQGAAAAGAKVKPFCYVKVEPDFMGDMKNAPEQGYTDFSPDPKPGYEPLYKLSPDPTGALLKQAKEALHAHNSYMLNTGFSGPDDAALHPNAAQNWRNIRAALAAIKEAGK